MEWLYNQLRYYSLVYLDQVKRYKGYLNDTSWLNAHNDSEIEIAKKYLDKYRKYRKQLTIEAWLIRSRHEHKDLP